MSELNELLAPIQQRADDQEFGPWILSAQDVPYLLAALRAGQEHRISFVIVGGKETGTFRCLCGEKFNHYAYQEAHREAKIIEALKDEK